MFVFAGVGQQELLEATTETPMPNNTPLWDGKNQLISTATRENVYSTFY